MKQAMPKKPLPRLEILHMGHRLREGLFILCIAVALFLLVSFLSYHDTDPSWSSTGMGRQLLNVGGRAGAFLSDIFLSFFGLAAYFFPPLLVFVSWRGMRDRGMDPLFNRGEFAFKCVGFLFIFLSATGLVTLYHLSDQGLAPTASGGIIGSLVVTHLVSLVNPIGGALFLITALLCGTTLFAGVSWLRVIETIGAYVTEGNRLCREWIQKRRQNTPDVPVVENRLEPAVVKKSIVPSDEARVRIIEPLFVAPVKEKKRVISQAVPSAVTLSSGVLPPFDLLNAPPVVVGKAFSSTSFEDLSILVEQRLRDFGVEAKVVAVHPGPIITRFELDLAPGIKVSKITGLSKDIARSLSVTSVRVVEVIPGKSVIGLELPNEHRELVCLRDILESVRYSQSSSPISLALGKDIAGYPIVVDLAKMPHLLVAGTTGAGKSVSLNGMLLSMLFKATPKELRLIMIDPKMLELSVYEGIPHLLTPVIIDMKDAANALRWCVAEMDRRYRLMASLGVRNLEGYNIKVKEAINKGNPLPTPDWMMAMPNQSPTLESLPLIVVVVDELADMMMVVGKKVEDLIARIAQKARAAGIHLILATQRPSVDVITGLIKANVPTRIAFQVSSRIDSRTILDQQGAEQLLGNGDMLYLPPGTGVPIRVHGAYVADEEVHRVVAAWQTAGQPTYLEGVTDEAPESGDGSDSQGTGESDPLYDEALRIVTESRRASISLVQRRLRIGYNRAARIMEDMEAAGVISQMDGNGSREVVAPSPI